MAELSIVAYILLNVIIILLYYNKPMGVFQFPFLIACVSLTFVTPQLLGIYADNKQDPSIVFPIFIFITCNIGAYVGFFLGKRLRVTKFKTLGHGGMVMKIIMFAMVGIVTYILNRGVYKGGFVSGVYVIINFFTQYLSYALILIMLLFKSNFRFPQLSRIVIFTILCVIIIINVDRFLMQARRAEAIQFVLIVSFFIFSSSKKYYKRYRLIIPLFFIFGLISGSQIGQYRANAYSGKVSAADNIQSLSFDFENIWIGSPNGEIRNAMLGINDVDRTGSYDYGAFNWNTIIVNYVPKILVGDAVKQNLMIDAGGSKLVSHLTKSGSTMTGYYDSFKSFGVFAAIKFVLIGLVMGVFWRKSLISNFYLLPYFGCVTASLHILTHSSGNFVSALIFWIFFVYPFLSKDEKTLARN